MIHIHNISLSFADRTIFDGITWLVPEKSRIGLVGDNGTGKTTLLKAIMGMVDLDAGAVEIPNRKNRTMGYLPQDLVELEPLPLMDYLRVKSGLAEMEQALKDQERRLSRCRPGAAEYPAILKDYEAAAARFQANDGYRFAAKAKQILSGFGFREKDFTRSCTEFSGGWKMRILIALILLSEPDIMLLDEPTNHLDTESMEWLESYLKGYAGTILTIAHDRVFLDKIVNQIAELSNCRLVLYKGNYSYYLAEKERRRDALLRQMALQRSEIKKTQQFIERFRFKATKARQVQSRIKMLERFELIEPEGREKRISMRFPEAPKSGRDVIAARQLSKRYGDVTVFSDVDLTIRRGEKIALVGVNGAGKSTLARLLSNKEEPSSGQVLHGLNVSTAFFSQESALNLDYRRTVWEEVRLAGTRSTDQERRNLLGAFLFSGDDVFKPISVLSGGEKSRLSLLKILLQDSNLLVLDEPTNHLDHKTKDIFNTALLGYKGTVIIVSHDRFFLDRLVHRVIEIRDGRLHDYLGNYSYFIKKRAELLRPLENGAVPAGPRDPPGSGAENMLPDRNFPAAKKPFRTKEEKRHEAQQRNRLFRITRNLKSELAALEERIASLEQRKAEYEAELCGPGIHREPHRIRQLDRELSELVRELEGLYEAWGRRSAELQAAQTDRNPSQP